MPQEARGQPHPSRLENDQPAVYHLAPDSRGGQAYKLVYLVRVPLRVYWKFKTDFDNDFLAVSATSTIPFTWTGCLPEIESLICS